MANTPSGKRRRSGGLIQLRITLREEELATLDDLCGKTGLSRSEQLGKLILEKQGGVANQQ